MSLAASGDTNRCSSGSAGEPPQLQLGMMRLRQRPRLRPVLGRSSGPIGFSLRRRGKQATPTVSDACLHVETGICAAPASVPFCADWRGARQPDRSALATRGARGEEHVASEGAARHPPSFSRGYSLLTAPAWPPMSDWGTRRRRRLSRNRGCFESASVNIGGGAPSPGVGGACCGHQQSLPTRPEHRRR